LRAVQNRFDLKQNLRYETGMKIRRLLLLGTAVSVPQLGGAQLPIPNEAFAKIESVLDFCIKADPKDSDKYEKLREGLMKDSAEKDMLEARESQEYKDAYQQEKGEFTKMPKEKAIEACSASISNVK
jgi:hypothetical protein